MLDQSTTVREYFDVPYARRVIMRETSEEKLMVLGTVLLYMDIVENGVACSAGTVRSGNGSPGSCADTSLV